jgi:MAF protein
VILASSSPRRRELLLKLIDDFIVRANDAEEIKCGARPSAVVMKNARAKAFATTDNGVIVAADTVVFMDGVYYLKPNSAESAVEMLKKLSGRTHYVYTGVCVKRGNEVKLFYDKSAVRLKKLSDGDIYEYVTAHNPLDKAGAYAIQDNVVVCGYRGSYSNIVGLPLEKLSAVLSALGVSVKPL